MSHSDLIDVLVAKQQELGYTDARFAERLGLDHASWWRLRRRERTAGRHQLARILRHAKAEMGLDLGEHIINDLASA